MSVYFLPLFLYVFGREYTLLLNCLMPPFYDCGVAVYKYLFLQVFMNPGYLREGFR